MTYGEQLECAKRELARRKRAFPAHVAAGTLTPAKSAFEIGGIESIIKTLEKLVMLEQVSEEMKSTWPRRD